MVRKIIFWSHLVCGVATGLIVFWMSLTGVLLTYERQILAWDTSKYYLTDENTKQDSQPKIAYQQLFEIAKSKQVEQAKPAPNTMVIRRVEGTAVEFKAGRGKGLMLNPYTGETMLTSSPTLASFFHTVTALHRWLTVSSETRSIGKTITGVSNLLFLFLILSGIYLWLPKVWRWGMLRMRLLFVKMPTSRARDFNWHHVFGFWSVIPLTVVVVTAVVFSFSWANKAVFSVYGEEMPSRSAMQFSYKGKVDIPAGATPLIWSTLVDSAADHFSDWQTISMTIPKENSETAVFTIDRGNGGQPQLRDKAVLNRYTGELLAQELFSDRSAGMQTRSIIRFLHTGEALGWIGQTVAGLVSFTTLFMVWTGLALSYRRLIQPLFSKKNGKKS